jgi:hypothetical protein
VMWTFDDGVINSKESSVYSPPSMLAPIAVPASARSPARMPIPAYIPVTFIESVRANFRHPITWALLLAGFFGSHSDFAPLMRERMDAGPRHVGWTNGIKHIPGILLSFTPAMDCAFLFLFFVFLWFPSASFFVIVKDVASINPKRVALIGMINKAVLLVCMSACTSLFQLNAFAVIQVLCFACSVLCCCCCHFSLLYVLKRVCLRRCAIRVKKRFFNRLLKRVPLVVLSVYRTESEVSHQECTCLFFCTEKSEFYWIFFLNSKV